MKEFQVKKEFSGAWEEELDNSINLFGTLSIMCELKPDYKLKSIPVMISGDALSVYAFNLTKLNDY